MTLLCERCYGPIDPAHERYYQLAHIAGADRTGTVAWNHATVHTEPCGVVEAGDVSDVGQQRRAA
jgi:hypothetical protein